MSPRRRATSIGRRQADGVSGVGRATNAGRWQADDAADDPLLQAVRRWRRPSAQSVRDVRDLAQRLDDKGCAYGRVSAARLDDLSRAFDRLESKLNAVLLGVTSTFVTTMVGLLIFYLRT